MRIQYDTTEGKALGAGVQRVERRLSIAGTPATATYTSVRAPLDAPGMPIGVFSSVLTAEQSQALRRTAHAAKWDAPQAPGRGGPGRSYMQVRYEDESLQATLGFSQMDIEVMEQVESFLEQLRSVVGMVTAHPKRALRVGGVHRSGPAWQPKSAQAHIVQAVVHDYEAPEQIDGVPCLRGAAFSEHLDLPRAK